MERVDKKTVGRNGLRRTTPPANGNGKKKRNKPGPKCKFTSDQVELVENFAKLGATNNDFAELFGVAVQTIEKWVRDEPDFYNAKLRGGKQFDASVAQAAAKKATGYEYTEVSVKETKNGVERTVTTKHVPPDTGAFIFWLTNRQPDLWKHMNTMKHEHSGNIQHNHRHIQEIDVTKLSEQAQQFMFEAGLQQLSDGTANN